MSAIAARLLVLALLLPFSLPAFALEDTPQTASSRRTAILRSCRRSR